MALSGTRCFIIFDVHQDEQGNDAEAQEPDSDGEYYTIAYTANPYY